MIQAVRPGRKHMALLAALVAMLVAQPLLGHRSVVAGAFFDTVLSGICLYMFFIVFVESWQRRVALLLLLPAFAGNAALYFLPRAAHILPEVLFHVSMVAFLGFTVVVILREILRKNMIHGDDVIGALCGYIIIAMAWASLYTLTYLIAPATFSVNSDIAARLAEWHQRRALFDYLSFTTLMTLGYGDITPIGPPAYTLTWLEVMAGQFYMAVVVAQLVGLKLAQALRAGDPGPK
jgi:voltage-gated potassium channel